MPKPPHPILSLVPEVPGNQMEIAHGISEERYTIGAYVFLIKERMIKDMAVVLDRSYPEQAILGSLKCLRLLAEELPECVRVHFRKKDFELCRAGFQKWYEEAYDKLPAEYRDPIAQEANAEFTLFEERVLKRTTQ